MDASLQAELHELVQIEPAALEEYERAAEALVEAVTKSLMDRSDIDELLGGNPVEMMAANHRHHHLFMANVFAFGSASLLRQALPWVYSTYRKHGFSYAYFVAELQAWLEAMARHLPPSSFAQTRPVYDWMLRVHPETIRAAESRPGGTVPVQPRWRPCWAQLVNLLQAGDWRGSLELARTHIGEQGDARTFCLEALVPALYEIGRLWEVGEISVAQEHLASAAAGRLMVGLSVSRPRCRDGGGKAVVTSAPNEYHEVGARMVADFLEWDGWQVRYLGANTPPEELKRLMLRDPPDVLLVSVCVAFNLRHARDLIRATRQAQELRSCRIMVGGQAFDPAPDLWSRVGADGYARDAAEATELARRWYQGESP